MSPKYYWLTIFSIVVVAFVSLFFLFSPSQAKLQLGRYDQASCTIDVQPEKPVFTFLTASSLDADKILTSLCHDPVMKAAYRKIVISWPPREQLSAEKLLSGQYQLIWSREHNFSGALPNYQDYYKPLLKVDGYKVFWYSRLPNVELTQTFLKDKKIGLLDSKVSHTHYLLPLRSLRQANMDLTSEQLIHFKDALGMYSAFREGKLDLISSGIWIEPSLDFKFYKYLIDDNAVAFSLFIALDTPAQAQCAVLNAMQPVYNLFDQNVDHLKLPEEVRNLCL